MDVEQRARELLAAEYAKGQFRAYAAEIRDGTTVAFDEEIRATVAIIAALTPPEGHVVVARNEAGQAVAVTRQDDEGRILSVIAEFQHHPSVPVATLAALADRWASERDYTGSPVDDIRALIDEPTAARPEVPDGRG
ncbi:hypothetical protein [Stenotrophomonas maltophilia]|uniref:hypothetical protein n=1 Tax=Stenotrophomonas maltophilia TaxID=40324 RepID=UPI0007F89887|nr:hypothetical protein [Stenotrophomonas maltophilia]OBU59225.1 hypothetical protein A9K70_01495 [Stenotrophomonas maltophilia]